ncbi:MAG: hypothetical protein O9346_08590 [Leptospiraceae bacterium]|nr:hypothetical protein [Leptospiraceae bacterium]MCZ8346458.1 hypothetical protein [Leptospiraceae bacterium]PJE01181.1 MAG: hypothetical protein CK427_11660 [Leptospira sp.]
MEEEDLLELALGFFNLELPFTEEEFHAKYRELAKKYHPDAGEYTSSILFNELMRSKEILEQHLKRKTELASKTLKQELQTGMNGNLKTKNTSSLETENLERRPSSDISYMIYKKAKDEENIAILEYFDKTKGNPVFLDPDENPPLKKLISDLISPLSAYNTILKEYPESIWVNDARDSIKRLGTWIGKNKSIRRP